MTMKLLLLLSLPSFALGFVPIAVHSTTRNHHVEQPTILWASGKGFGKKNRYEIFERGSEEEEGSMSNFFSEQSDWMPLFRSLVADAESSSPVPAKECLDGSDNQDDFDFLATNSPWKALPAIPDDDDDKQVIGTFLDGTQAALSTLPALTEEDDETDMAFLLEGKRMLAVSRFQVIRNNNDNDLLFATCWNEVTQLARDNQPDTGSVILLPDLDDDDDDFLKHFCATRLQQPLQWLGLDGTFEVASISTGTATTPVPALRVLHKLEEIRDLSERESFE